MGVLPVGKIWAGNRIYGKAAELEPANAVISDHLGDAYWLGGRKNEAGFQWNHVLVMKDDTGEVDYDFVRRKIDGEAPKNEVPPYNEELIEEKSRKFPKSKPFGLKKAVGELYLLATEQEI